MNLLRTYYEVLVGFRREGLICTGAVVLSGIFEGTALLTLIPILQLNMSSFGYDNQGGEYLRRFAAWSGLDGQGMFLAGLVAFCLLGLATAGLTFASEALRIRLRSRLEQSFRTRMSDALLQMEWAHFLSLKGGDISKSMVMEGFQIAIGSYYFLRAIGLAVIAFVFLGAAFFVAASMTCYTLLFGLVGVIIYRLITRRGYKHTDKLSTLLSTIGECVSAVFDNLKFYRATGQTGLARAEARQIYGQYAKTYFRSEVVGEVIRFILQSGSIVFITAFLFIMLYMQQESVAKALVFLAIFYRLAPRLITAQESFFQCRLGLPFYWTWKERYDQAMAHPTHVFGRRDPTYARTLEFRGAGYAYPGAARPALEDVSFALPQGQCVAVVGASGSGKSTLIDLALGLMPPTSGSLVLDGIALDELDIERWRSRIGLVLQESPIFHASIRQNIAWGDAEPDQARVEAAATMAQAREFIEPLPEAYDTIVGEKGGRLSGGQRQRLALARALYREPWLLILDEATSALDSNAEGEVQKALEKVKGAYSILMVAHRLKTVQMADRIIVLDAGRIVEQGSWDELLARPDGAFRNLARLQGVTGS